MPFTHYIWKIITKCNDIVIQKSPNKRMTPFNIYVAVKLCRDDKRMKIFRKKIKANYT